MSACCADAGISTVTPQYLPGINEKEGREPEGPCNAGVQGGEEGERGRGRAHHCSPSAVHGVPWHGRREGGGVRIADKTVI